MTARSDLLDQLTEEMYQGWPVPYDQFDAWAADADPDRSVLHDYIDLLGDAVAEANRHSGIGPNRSAHIPPPPDLEAVA